MYARGGGSPGLERLEEALWLGKRPDKAGCLAAVLLTSVCCSPRERSDIADVSSESKLVRAVSVPEDSHEGVERMEVVETEDRVGDAGVI